MALPMEIERALKEVRLSRNYVSTTLSAGKSIVFTDKGVFGKPANLFVAAAEEESQIRINDGAIIPMKRDEAIVIINALDIESVEVVSGSVKIFATIVPRWMPAMFWTRSVTVIGVADAVKQALQDYGAAKDTTVQNITKLQFDTDNDLYVLRRAKEGTPTDYTTTDSWAAAVTINALLYDKLTILIKNTGANSADIKVVGKAAAAGTIEEEILPATTINPGEVKPLHISDVYSQIIVYAKSSISGASTTIRIEWVGRK